MHVMAVSTISDNDKFWGSLKNAYGQLPKGAQWTLAIGSVDGSKAVNVIVHESIGSVKAFFEEHTGPYGTTEFFEADEANAIGLPKEQLPTTPAASSAEPDLRRGGPPAKGIAAPQIQARVAELLAEYGIPSAAIGILHNGTITDFAVGHMNLGTRTPATTDTIYQCGSMTKTWTALAFMQLLDEGKVALDEPVRFYLPGFKVADPDVSAMVTPRHFLDHTNGIEEAIGDPGEDIDVYERIVRNIADAPQVFPLGHTHGYSAALGYAVLARIMEVVDGKPWDTIMKDRLFDPLELSSTSSFHEQVDQNRAATGYLVRSLEGDPVPSPVAYLPRSYGPGGNINSTPREVLTMAHLFLNGGKAPNGREIVSAAAIREMTESRVLVPDPYLLGSEWALGLTVYNWYGENVFAHDGSTIGQHARLRILPDSNLAIAMMGNGGPRDSFYRKVFNAILTECGAVTVPDLPRPNPTITLDVSKYEGAFERPGSRYEVIADGEKLTLTIVVDPHRARVLGKPQRIICELLPIDETHFLMPSNDPLEDTQTVAIYDFQDGVPQYLHMNARVIPRVGNTR